MTNSIINNEKKENNYRLLQILNIMGFVGMVVVNFLANYLPINGLDTGYISDLYPNLFTPAGFTFSIWGLIYLLLGIFVVYQAWGISKSDSRQLAYIKRIGYLFFYSCLLNTAWIFAWHYLLMGLSLVIMILLLTVLIFLYNRLNQIDKNTEEKGSKITRAAFSIYLGWITIATVANMTAFLVASDWGRFGLSEVFWMIVVVLIAAAIVSRFMFKNRDWIYGLVAIWAFFGILMKRITVKPVITPIIVVVAICMIIITAGIVKVMRDNKEETY